MKRKLWMKIFTILMAMSLLLGLGAGSARYAQAAEVSSDIVVESADGSASGSEDEFRVGMEAGYPPFNWTQTDDSNGAVRIDGNKEYAGGYDVQIAKKVAEGLGKKLVIVKTEWDGLVPALVSGKIDAIIAGMSPTAERKETIDFSDIYYKSDLIIVVKKGEAYEDATSIADFKGAKITAQLNTFHYGVIDQIEGVIRQTAMDNFTAMRVALEAGMIDGYVSEKPEGVSASMANSNFAMVEFDKGKGFATAEEDTAISVGIAKDSELTGQINEILSGISEEERTELMDEAILEQPASGGNKTSFQWFIDIMKENGPMFLRGAGMTLLISLTGTILGFLIGLLVGVIKTIPMPLKGAGRTAQKIINGLLSVYVEFFRGTPMIVQAMVIYYGSALAFDIHMNRLAAAIFIVSINTGAYMSEIIRGGIVSIDKGQFEAAQAVGMNHVQTMTNVVLPQVIRNILPATGNEFVINIKDTSVLNVIAVTELFFQTKSVAGNNFRYFESFFVACILYFIMTFTVTRILRHIEKRLDGPANYNMITNQAPDEDTDSTAGQA
ncbi:ABC transporter permease subunit [Anaerobium acetethylicum]|uniref:Putative lysine transport system permease protein n=1 Tax=Anaerobium acetethylicum TaxID=1619234 RepID=A0A1D3TR75_9FIRM|nr:ABC transporter permease subunit [Anaerobium acetethylicum]SCP96166.1 putative lysine transport system permease protein [Anaerobium acetethylicum]